VALCEPGASRPGAADDEIIGIDTDAPSSAVEGVALG
jgi:hypothetical protein